MLFLQSPAAAGPPPKPPEQVAGNWAITRGTGAPVCALTLATTVFARRLRVDGEAGLRRHDRADRLTFTQWRMDRGELELVSARGITWRFEPIDNVTWRRLPESADQIMLVRQ